MRKIRISLFLFCLIFISQNLFAQEALKSTEEDYYDFLSLTGIVERPALGYRTLSDSVWNFSEDSADHIWKNNNLGTTYTLWQASQPADNFFARGLKQGLTARIYGPEWFNSYNTGAPYGQNDGALWQGRGYNTSLTTGLRLEGYGFELTFKPMVGWMQNGEFSTNKDVYPNPYSYSFASGTVYHNIDLVQRYGDSSLFNYDWGDSEVRWTWHTLTFGFGTQNPWLGPAYLNPMLGSNNAPGYLKFDAGLRKTKVILPFLNWNLGNIEGRIFVGQLKESDYYDKNPDNDDRMLIGMTASYNPSFIPGFTIGLNRVFLTYWDLDNLSYIYRLFTASRSNGTSSGNDEDQKFSIFAEWTFPKAGFTVYGEYGRDDFSFDEKTNPFHTAIYTVGARQGIPLHFTKLFPNLPEYFDLESELTFEWNNFEMSQDFQLQWAYLGYYAHGFVGQGYTHKGQVLGAASCWAGNSQFIQYKILYPKGATSFIFHRFSPNNNSVYSQSVYTVADAEQGPIFKKWYANFETYYCFGVKSNIFIINNLNLNLGFNYIGIYHYQYKNECISTYNIQAGLKYNF